MRSARIGAAVGVALSLHTLSSNASANTFLDDGTFRFSDDALLTDSFEAPKEAYQGNGNFNTIASPNALDGSQILTVFAQNDSAELRFPISGPKRMAKASVWVRSFGVVGTLVENAQGAVASFTQLFPTGRVTSDGWMELESSPMPLDPAQSSNVYVFFYGSFEADALQWITVNNEPWLEASPCFGLTDPTCGGDRICMSGLCQDPRGWVPPLPSDPPAVTRTLETRLKYFLGPYASRENHLETAIASMNKMHLASSRWQFWNGFTTALQRLRDSHTTSYYLSQFIFENPRPMNACFIVGLGDVSQHDYPTHPQWPDVLVSHVGTAMAWGIEPGDRLVEVDGRHPIDWAQSLLGYDQSFSPPNDPASLSMYVEGLRASIPRYAKSLTVLQCKTSPCTRRTIEVASIETVAPGTDVGAVACDHRPQPLVAGQPSTHRIGTRAYSGPVRQADTSEKIYGLVWDYLITGTPAQNTISTAATTWAGDGRGVILDHRTGNGGSGAEGTTSIAEPIISFVHKPSFFGINLFRKSADEEGPRSLEEGLDMIEKFKNTNGWRGGSNRARQDVPVALLITRDVSFSDLFPYAFQSAPKVRVFGPHPTNGAFSTFMGLSYWMGLTYQVAVGDTIGANGQALCGHGVAPHQVVLPLQSDLLQGRDTAIEAALTWIRSEVQAP